ncbi:MAG: alpha-glucan phosphorylase [Gemmatimonadota bacterium]|nr:MAG: alpha-glucan phosphorylase [Gemmatimonadota bacterium]
MLPHQSFSVVPQLPKSLERLRELAWNLRFSWDPETGDLFQMMDADLWDECGQNPVQFLGRISQVKLEECAKDDALLSNLERVSNDFSKYLASDTTWFHKSEASRGPSSRIAYFSAEFGLSPCLPLYSGGLGVLAGDHLKAASDLGLPLTGVGLLYQRGYFQQYLNSDGWQQEKYPTNDFHNLPLRPARAADGSEVMLHLPLDDRTLLVKVWQADVGRVPLVLLDTNVPGNPKEYRTITADLYGGDSETRLLQEYVLGIGGVRALHALDREPDVFHMNEGHSAFLVLERMRILMERDGLTFEEARTASGASTVFTTHTPVHAAIDLFSTQQMTRVFPDWMATFDQDAEEFMDLGREVPGEGPFNMAVFALRSADATNGVSRLHGKVSRGMWKHLWPGVPEDEVPIQSVTNGIHTQTWISRGMRELFDRHLGRRWSRDPDEASLWDAVEKIPAEALWRAHEVQRQRLVSYVRDRMRAHLELTNGTSVEIANVNEVLDANALTIGFARRFAPYKRGNLILRDVDRLLAILNDAKRPVQFIIAGKSHPKDEPGKKLIQEIVQFSRDERVRGRIVFVEDYDMDVAAHLVQGVDVWLNNPRRPLEASGTSGMKASANGAINMSVLDGWWDEAAEEHLGWSIGNGEVYADKETQDQIESGALYDLLEHEVIPLFFDRGRDGLPRGWIRMMREAIRGLAPVFNTNRMVAEYAQRFYLPTAARAHRLSADSWKGGRDLAAWKHRVTEAWPNVRVSEIESEPVAECSVGQVLPVRARVDMGGLAAADLEVQLYHGEISPEGEIEHAEVVPMVTDGAADNGSFWFSGEVPCPRTGHRGFAVRVLPHHADQASSFRPALIRWNSDPVGNGAPELVPA